MGCEFMLNKSSLFLVICALGLSACQTTERGLRQTAEGADCTFPKYGGNIRDISKPIIVKYTALKMSKFSYHMISEGMEDIESDLTITGSLRVSGGEELVRMALWVDKATGEVRGEPRRKQIGVVFNTERYQQGTVTQNWFKGAASTKDRKDMLNMLPAVKFPKEGLVSGDSLSQAHISLTQVRTPIRSKVLGQVTFKGRTALAVSSRFETDKTSRGAKVHGKGGGFSLLDIQSGQILLSRSLYCLNIKTPNETGDMITKESFELHIGGTTPTN
jgi:hypothetical protein